MANGANFTIVTHTSGDGAAVYDVRGDLLKTGHVDDVQDWLIAHLGVSVLSGDIIKDKSATGWNGIATSLLDVVP